MPLLSLLLQKIAPLYALILLGWWAGHRLQVRKEAIANLLIYCFLPIVIFHSVLHSRLEGARIWLPLIVFGICTLICGLAWLWSRDNLPSPTSNLFAFAAGNANSGYFGFPLALALYGEEGLGLAVLISMGFVFYENTLGYYICARGKSSPREALNRVLRLPDPYAFVAALLARKWGVTQIGWMEEWSVNTRACYSILGMMLIGMGMAECRWKDLDFKFVNSSLVFKFVLWPLVMGGLLALFSWLSPLDPQVRRSLWLVSTLPMAGNVVAIAAALHLEPQKAALTVFLSTLLGMICIPVLLSLLV